MGPFSDLKTLLENPTIQKTTRNPFLVQRISKDSLNKSVDCSMTR